VAQAVVVPCEDRREGRSGTVPKAFVVVKEGVVQSDALAAELIEHCQASFERAHLYKYPRFVQFIAETELHKTAGGKIQRFKFREPA
jgi:acyl-coenzyme A synthetase/AMP-(fatty) acid ligase